MDNGAIFCDFCGQELTARPQPARTTPRPAGYISDSATLEPPQTPPAVERLPTTIALRLSMSQSFALHGKTDYLIGRIGTRRERPDVDLAKWYGYEGGVSRAHAAIHLRREGVFIEDLNSRNETIKNNYRLLPRQWYPLHDGDEIRLGAIRLRVSFQY
jgi:hypothetical protein